MNRKYLFAGLFLGGALAVVYAQSGPSYDNSAAEIALVSSTGSAPYSAMTTTGSTGQSYDYAPTALMLGRNANGKYYVCGDANPCTGGGGGGGGFTAGGDLSGTSTSQNVIGSHIVSGSAALTGQSSVSALSTGSAPATSSFTITDGRTGSLANPINFFGSAISNAGSVYVGFGRTLTTNNAMYMGFNFVSTGSNLNNWFLQPYGSGQNAFAVNASGDAIISHSIQVPTYLTATNCSSTASPAVCGAAAAGKVQVAAAGTTLTVNTTAITANSECHFTYSVEGITPPANIAALLGPYMSARTAGTSFTITLPVAPVTSPVNILYSCVN